MVEHPPHYQTESGLEAIDVIEAFFADNAHLANAFRYMSRLDKKWDGDEDLDKAIWYLQRLREFRNGDTEAPESSESDVPDKFVYEFFGRVSNVQFESTMDTTEVDLALTPTMISAATHRIRFEISRDNGANVADLFFGKPAQSLTPEVATAHYATGGLFRVGDRVRVIKNPGMTGAVQVGAIGKIQAGPDFDGDYEVKFEDDWHYFEPDEIEIADEPKAGDVLTVTDTDGHNFPHGTQVKVDAPGAWGGAMPHRYVLCSRTDGEPTEGGMRQQAIRLDCINW